MKGKSTDQNKKEYMLEQQKYAGKNTDLVQAFLKAGRVTKHYSPKI